MKRRPADWTRDELILAFNVYSQIPFGTIHMRNPKVIELAKLVGRSVGAASYKLSNFARLDPALKARGIKGSPHGAKGEEHVWSEFAANPEALAFESERLKAQFLGKTIEEVAEIETKDLPAVGLERETLVRVRVNQSFFRRRVISAYNYRCCVTGLTCKELLVASHIIPWSKNPETRLDPRNGLCLNALHDRAFDRGLMSVDSHLKIRFAPAIKNSRKDETLNWLTSFEGKPLLLPSKFSPQTSYLAVHLAQCYWA
jgi:putative restriction endonuclease